jgi:hypothetical protein
MSVFVTLQITLSGLAFVLINFATLSFYDPTYLTAKGGATGPPNWVYFTCVALQIVPSSEELSNPASDTSYSHIRIDGPPGCSCIKLLMR